MRRDLFLPFAGAVVAGGALAIVLGETGASLAVRTLLLTAAMALVATRPRAPRPSPALDRLAREKERVQAELAPPPAPVAPPPPPEPEPEAAPTPAGPSGEPGRETYIAAVSHELRTPLNAILGFTQVLLSEIDGPLSPPQREDVVAIHEAGVHLKALVDEVIGESAGAPDARTIGPVEVEPLVRELGRGLEAQLRGRPITLRIHVEADLPTPIGDPRRMRQLLWNLGTNAVRYTDRGEIAVSVARDGEQLRFSVRDTGRGIAASDLERIFAPGERVERQAVARATRAKPTEGWGLGLAIAQEMAEFHQGRIEVESVLGQGSTFSFVMPARGLE
ncbi:MAG: HAMP domain-containing sensor histidine kinase [Sandaracinus sp.]